jgi:REP element-mobilizing transposase RayT
MRYKSIYNPDHLYFVTTTVAEWKCLFYLPQYAKIVLDSINFLHQKGFINLYAFCLMPNHFHYLIKPLREFMVNDIVAKFTSYTSHQILKLSKLEDNREWLESFKQFAEKYNDRQHRIWGDSLDRNVDSTEVLEEVLEYIHNNPINKNWNLVEDRADYLYSSACFYDLEKEPIIAIEDVREIWD